VIFEDIFQGKENLHFEAGNMVYKNVVISDTQVLFCHSVTGYYKVKSFIIVLRLLTWSGGSLCIGSQERVPYLQQKPAYPSLVSAAHFCILISHKVISVTC
jgi:hypothetical protein